MLEIETTKPENYFDFHACIGIYTEVKKLPEKLAKFYMWNVKQKDDGMNQNTLFCCYSDYESANL